MGRDAWANVQSAMHDDGKLRPPRPPIPTRELEGPSDQAMPSRSPPDDRLPLLLTITADLLAALRANGLASATLKTRRVDVVKVPGTYRWTVTDGGTLLLAQGEAARPFAACAAAAEALLSVES